jgi:hypothetical protein
MVHWHESNAFQLLQSMAEIAENGRRVQEIVRYTTFKQYLKYWPSIKLGRYAQLFAHRGSGYPACRRASI